MSTATEQPKAHAIFEKHPGHQWTGKLVDLLPRLTTEAREQEPGAFAWRVLRGGAVIGLRVNQEHMRLELRIARAEPPETQQQSAKWEHEIGVFLKHFGITAVDGETPAESEHDHWLELPDPPEDDGKATARYLQLRKGEVRVGKALCHPCLQTGVATPMEWFPGGGVTGQNCTAHAFQAGAKQTQAVQARLQEPETIDLMKALTTSLKKGRG